MSIRLRGRRLALVSALLVGACIGPAAAVRAAQAPGAPAPVGANGVTSAPTLSERRATLSSELAESRRRLEASETDADRRAVLEQEVRLLERVDLVLGQHEAATQRIAELTAQKTELADALTALQASGPSEPPPYSLLLLDELRDRLEAQEARTESLAAAVDAASGAVVEADQTLDQLRVELRRAREAESANADESLGAGLAAASRLLQFETRVAEETVALRRTELQREALSQDVHEVQVETLRERIEWVSRATAFTRSDLDAKRLEIETGRARARQRLEMTESTRSYLEGEWFDAKRRRDATAAPDDGLTEEVAAKLLARDVARETIEAMGKRIEHLTDAEIAWRRRFDLDDSTPAPVLEEWSASAAARIDALTIEERVVMARSAEIRTRLGVISARLESSGPDAAVQWWLREQQKHLRAISEVLDGRLQSVDAARRLHQRLLSAIGVRATTVSFAERIHSIWEGILSIWHFGIWNVDDNPITVGKIGVGLLILCMGVFASRWISGLLGRRVLPRFKLNEGASAAIQSIMFYILIVTFTLIAFRAVNIPLTAFTVAGGALAIGVGFGSQNVIANFISGLIILAERPVRVGDLVDVGGLYGTVEHIGARSTRLRTGDNVDIVVPNSTFLEQNVVNWTLTEDKIRIFVGVGVAYGSPTRDVSRLLTRAVEEHGRVHNKPSPIVLFKEFGDNSLNFEVHFWITMKRLMDRRIIESDVRHRIDSLFREAGITIAFPQRDVHFDAASPIPVRIVADDAPPGDDGA
ncbi:MAG: mechanosensitive ion channel [Phycisphaerales bacterium]|nr:mechanosensitive ion channel [Phycisphaerales bacterium]